MNSLKVKILSFVMLVIFAFAMVTIASNSLMTAEEELIETIHQINKEVPNSGYQFDFNKDEEFRYTASYENIKLTLYCESFEYDSPLLDIPLMPPELISIS